MYQDTVGLLQPTMSVLWLCGICPSDTWIPQTSNGYKLYTLSLTMVSSILITMIMVDDYLHLNDISCFFAIMKDLVLLAFILVAAVSPYLTSNDLAKFFRIIESAQQSLFSLNIRQPEEPSVRSQTFWMFFLFSPTICFTIVSASRITSMVWFMTLIPSVIKIATVCKIRVLLDLVNGKFNLLNWHLDDLNDRWPLFLPRPPDVKFRHLSPIKRLRKSKFIEESRDDRSVTAKKIKLFNRAHLELYFALKTVNKVISATFLFLYLSIGMSTATLVFRVSIQVFPVSQLSAIMTISENIIILGLVSTMATMCEINSKKAGRLVHELMSEERHCPETMKELENFSIALLYRKFSLTALGFFDVNLKLVSKMASLLAPIILFLVQNNNRPRSGRTKKA